MITFPVRTLLDEEGNPIAKDGDELRFIQGRDGDHLMTPFQCEICHFRNIQQRDPVPTHVADERLLAYIRRVNLDAFWKSEPTTVASNLRLVLRAFKTQSYLGIIDLFPDMGPYPVRDTFGMKEAVATLDKSLDKGRYESHVQWATFRQTRSAFTNLHQASLNGMSDRIGAYERNKTWITKAHTFGFFYTRFMEGAHKRVGETVMRDEPISIGVIKEIDRLLEEEWQRASLNNPRNVDQLASIALKGAWFLAGFCSALRGEEMLIIEYVGTRRSLKWITQHMEGAPPHFELVISGRTKNHRVSGGKFSIPIAATTEGTGLRPGIWVTRYCQQLNAKGRTRGFLFGSNDDDSPRLGAFHNMFHGVLQEVQASRPDLIPEDVVVSDVYGILRSSRRGVAGHSTNMGVPTKIMNAVSRWRVERNTDVPVLSMPEVYARLDSIKPTILRFSRPL